MKKIMMLTMITVMLATTSFMFATTGGETEKVPAGEVTANPQGMEKTEGSETEVLDLNEARRISRHKGKVLLEDDQGKWHLLNNSTAESGKEESQEINQAEDIEKDKENDQQRAKDDENRETEEIASTAESTSVKEASANPAGDDSDKDKEADQENKEAESIESATPTPPRSPNVPSYSMDRVGIYHNDEGAVTAVYPGASNTRLRVLVEKGGERSAYNLHDGKQSSDAVATYPLERGDGTYLVRIMENTEGNSYREVYRKEVTLQSQQEHAVYLHSIQEINWSTSDPGVQKAASLVAGRSSDREKVRAVYNYMVENIRYDHDKVDQLNTFYLPDINDTFRSQKGICYDYASLFAAMLRSQGIPTRMVKGYSQAIGNGEVYHAWNEVYLADEGRWVIIDTTHDASHVQQGRSVDMIKGSDGFSVTHRL